MSGPSSPAPEIDCREVVDHVFAYIDGDLGEDDRARIVGHLAVCAHCAVYVRHGERLLQCIGTRAKVQAAPASLRRRVLDALIELDQSITDS